MQVQKCSGFTLIQLLIAIAFIGTLAAILFPVLTISKTSGADASTTNVPTQLFNMKYFTLDGPTSVALGATAVYTLSVNGVPTWDPTFNWTVTATDGTESVAVKSVAQTGAGNEGKYNITFPAPGVNLILVATDPNKIHISKFGITVASPAKCELGVIEWTSELSTALDYAYQKADGTWVKKEGSKFSDAVYTGTNPMDKDNYQWLLKLNDVSLGTDTGKEAKEADAAITITHPVTDTKLHLACIYISGYGVGTLTVTCDGVSYTKSMTTETRKWLVPINYQSGTGNGTLTIKVTGGEGNTWGWAIQAVTINDANDTLTTPGTTTPTQTIVPATPVTPATPTVTTQDATSTVTLMDAEVSTDFTPFVDYIYVKPSYEWSTKAGSTFTTPVFTGETANDNDGNCLYKLKLNDTDITANNINMKSIGATTTLTRPVTDTKPHTAFLYFGGCQGTGTLKVRLNGTTATLVINPDKLGNFKHGVQLDFQSKTGTGILTITQDLTAQINLAWGIGLQAVAISN